MRNIKIGGLYMLNDVKVKVICKVIDDDGKLYYEVKPTDFESFSRYVPRKKLKEIEGNTIQGENEMGAEVIAKITHLKELPANCLTCEVHCTLPLCGRRIDAQIKKKYQTERHENCPLVKVTVPITDITERK